MRYTLKIARTDKGFATHRFTDLRACFSALDMLRSAGKVRRAWVYNQTAETLARNADDPNLGHKAWWSGLIYSN